MARPPVCSCACEGEKEERDERKYRRVETETEWGKTEMYVISVFASSAAWQPATTTK